MPELCALRQLELDPEIPIDVPPLCQEQCGELIEAVTVTRGDWDDYLRGRPFPDCEIEFSHDTIGISGLAGQCGRRMYTIVDQVLMDSGAEIEIGETVWGFECPYDSLDESADSRTAADT